MKTNPFTLEPCKTCGVVTTITGTQMKREILAWAGVEVSTTGPYGGNMSRVELMAVYTKIFGGRDEQDS
jgi:hypothetical protein